MARRQTLSGDKFCESFLIGKDFSNFPAAFSLRIWSSSLNNAYKIEFNGIAEMHFVHRNVFGVDWNASIPIDDIYVVEKRDFLEYWSNHQRDCDSSPPFTKVKCIEISSVVFGNRNHDVSVEDRDMGVLVVCTDLSINLDTEYFGPAFKPVRIPSDATDNMKH
jgi:hypothetical protein